MSGAYLDTSALLPLLDADDQDHARVVTALEQVAKQQTRLVTTSYTLVEAAALVRGRLGVDALRALGDVVDRAVEIVWVEEDLHRKAWVKTAAGGRRGPSLVDWVGFLVIAEHGLELALALDEHFGKQGIPTLP